LIGLLPHGVIVVDLGELGIDFSPTYCSELLSISIGNWR
jgi:hypothetical protein